MPVHTVLVLARDTLSSAEIGRSLEHAFPGAECLFPRSFLDAARVAAARRVDLLVADMDFPDGDVLDFIFECTRRRTDNARTFVIAACGGPRTLFSLQSLGVGGVFDPTSQPTEQFVHGLVQVGEGGHSWNENFLRALYGEAARVVRHQLTPREQLGLAVIGEGCGDAAAGHRLGMTLSSARSMRREIYAKLEVHGVDELIRRSGELGFTRFSRSGPRARGLHVLIHEYHTRSKRARRLPSSLHPATWIAPVSAAA